METRIRYYDTGHYVAYVCARVPEESLGLQERKYFYPSSSLPCIRLEQLIALYGLVETVNSIVVPAFALIELATHARLTCFPIKDLP